MHIHILIHKRKERERETLCGSAPIQHTLSLLQYLQDGQQAVKCRRSFVTFLSNSGSNLLARLRMAFKFHESSASSGRVKYAFCEQAARFVPSVRPSVVTNNLSNMNTHINFVVTTTFYLRDNKIKSGAGVCLRRHCKSYLSNNAI